MPTLIDHVNRNKSDNRIANLRLSDRTKNAQNTSKRTDNTSGYRGVTWHKKTEKWRVQIYNNGKWTHGGLYADKEDAARRYNELAIEYHGEFAVPN
jgi:hypothetical protein